jgi:hypothetical protein
MKKKPTQLDENTGKMLHKGWILWLAVLFMVTMLVNCRVEYHDDGDPPSTYDIQIVSDPNADGDIAFSPPHNFTVSSASTTGSVLAGIDPVFEDEYRGFLSFPLRGSHGVPTYAEIESATLEIFISDVTECSPGTGVPLLIDLVSFSPPILIASDYDRAPLLTLYSNIVFADDAGFFLSFDVTPLMVEAQRLDLNNFQLRFLLDSDLAGSGLIEIKDNVLETAPLLSVTYY